LKTAAEGIRERVLRGIALNREPGFFFSGNFLGLTFDTIATQDMRVSVETGPHCMDPDGQANFAVLAMLADMALAGCIRAGLTLTTRLATVSMNLQLTGARIEGRLEAVSNFQGFFGATSKQGLASVSVAGASGQVCFGTGTFMALAPPPGVTLLPLPDTRRRIAPVLAERDLTREERKLLRHAEKLLEAGEADFIRRFWGLEPRHAKDGASCAMKNGEQVANRVGHAQGGILLAEAGATASASLPESWALTGISAAFVSPGEGSVLRARSRVVHHGRMTAAVRTQITGAGRRRVLEAMSTHSRIPA